MKDKSSTTQDLHEQDAFHPYDYMMFSMPEMTPRGPGGRGCGRGRGPGRGGPGMGRGGRGCGRFRGPHGRPDPRQMPFEHWTRGAGVLRGHHGRPDPRQMLFEHWNQGSAVFGGPHGRPDPRQMPFMHCGQDYGGIAIFERNFDMPWAGHHCLGGPPANADDENSQAHKDVNEKESNNKESSSNMEDTEPTKSGSCAGSPRERHMRNQCFSGPPPLNRPIFMRRLDRQMNDNSGSNSDSDDDKSQDTADEDTKHDSEIRGVHKKGCRRGWRRFMRRQLSICPRRPVYGYGPPQAWRPPCAHPMASGPPPCGPMVPPHMLRRLHRLLTALESEMDKGINNGKDETKETETQESQREEATPRHARVQARLRRLIAHAEKHGGENVPFLQPHPPWMMRMQARPGCWDVPCHMRRMRKRMGRVHGACSTETTKADKPDQESKYGEDTPMATTDGPLDDWQDLRQDVDDLQHVQQEVPVQDASEMPSQSSGSSPSQTEGK